VTFNIDMYLELLKRTLTGMIYEDPAIPVRWRPLNTFNLSERLRGRDWPLNAHTMIGYKRLENIQNCMEMIIADGIPGDVIETGVWRGGACIFMRGVLSAHHITNRVVWVADSFDGFPPFAKRADDNELLAQPEQSHLAVPMQDVRHNFQLYGLMDKQVKFIPGWFSQTLPGPVKRLSLLRLDGDLYESTMDALTALYPLLEPGGFCIIDDWNVPMCRKAVWDYLKLHVIDVQFTDIDGHSIYWRKDA
jgi:hypothetical protein